jgi:hypothetical protein
MGGLNTYNHSNLVIVQAGLFMNAPPMLHRRHPLSKVVVIDEGGATKMITGEGNGRAMVPHRQCASHCGGEGPPPSHYGHTT